MTDLELSDYIRGAAHSLGISPYVLEAIPKNQLKVGYWYSGSCRNASKAMWTGNSFSYWRIKFGSGFWDRINHFEDDNGFDVFVPVRIKGTTR